MVPKIEETDAAFEFEHSEDMAEDQSDLPNQTEDYGKNKRKNIIIQIKEGLCMNGWQWEGLESIKAPRGLTAAICAPTLRLSHDLTSPVW